ncbi:MAG: MoaD/ThiS family protein [Akkermansiaceae bacterium]|nr:MoaD/ThiS family protein [Akkermansiaceae bacterium]
MTITVHYFGLLAERRRLTEERVETIAATAAELYSKLDADHHLGLEIRDFRVAVNDEFVAWDYLLQENDSVALLPPMSGG